MKDLIEKLQSLYSSYTDEYKSVMGEPEIMIDQFKRNADYSHDYVGWSPDIAIEKSSDGIYDIISRFYENEDNFAPVKAKKSYYQVWPFPEGGEASYNGPEEETG